MSHPVRMYLSDPPQRYGQLVSFSGVTMTS